MNKSRLQNSLFITFTVLMMLSTTLFAQGIPAGKIGAALNTHYSFEGAKFRVLASAEDLSKGKLILTCEDPSCGSMEGLYNADTTVYLPNEETGSTHDLLNYSDHKADITIRKTDNHIRRIRLYK